MSEATNGNHLITPMRSPERALKLFLKLFYINEEFSPDLEDQLRFIQDDIANNSDDTERNSKLNQEVIRNLAANLEGAELYGREEIDDEIKALHRIKARKATDFTGGDEDVFRHFMWRVNVWHDQWNTSEQVRMRLEAVWSRAELTQRVLEWYAFWTTEEDRYWNRLWRMIDVYHLTDEHREGLDADTSELCSSE
jgi:hypothetical protein